MPRGSDYVGFVFGAFLQVSATFTPVLVMALPVCILVLSVILLRGARQIPADARLPPGMGAAEPVGVMPRRRQAPPAPERRTSS